MQANATESLSFLTEAIRKRSIRQVAFRMNEVLAERMGRAEVEMWDEQRFPGGTSQF